MYKRQDLSTIEFKLQNGCYANPRGFEFEVRTMFSNAYQYNRRGSIVYRMCRALENRFNRVFPPAATRTSCRRRTATTKYSSFLSTRGNGVAKLSASVKLKHQRRRQLRRRSTQTKFPPAAPRRIYRRRTETNKYKNMLHTKNVNRKTRVATNPSAAIRSKRQRMKQQGPGRTRIKRRRVQHNNCLLYTSPSPRD